MAFRNVVFDLDGVLVDSRAGIVASVRSAYAACGLPDLPRERVERMIGPPLIVAIREVLAELGRDDAALADALLDDYRARYGAVAASGSSVYPGVAELLERLDREHVLAVATSKPEPYAHAILEAHGLVRYFRVVCAPALASANEAKTLTLRRALRELAEQPDCDSSELAFGSVMIGDRSHDVAAARANGIFALGVTWGFGSREELLDAGADAVADTPADVAALLDSPRHLRSSA